MPVSPLVHSLRLSPKTTVGYASRVAKEAMITSFGHVVFVELCVPTHEPYIDSLLVAIPHVRLMARYIEDLQGVVLRIIDNDDI